MSRGRKPKAPQVKREEGNPGKRAIPDQIQPSGTLKPPKTLSKEALTVFKQIVSSFPDETYASTDVHTLSCLCEAVADYWKAAHACEELGRYVNGSTGQLTIAPWVKDKEKQAALIYQFSTRLYLDPVARQRITSIDPNKIVVIDSLEQMLPRA
jgi:P27 family predicted phage terminase small subunit